MLPAPSLEEIGRCLRQNPAPLVALTFAQPSTKIAAETLIPRLAYFDSRTEQYIHFFFAGYAGYRFADDAIPVADGHYEFGTIIPWGFSQKKFAEFVNEMERTTRWRPSGDVDLILVEPKDPGDGGNPVLDFTQAVLCDVTAMIRDGVIDHASRLFEAIIGFARTNPSITPARFSDQQGLGLLGQAAADTILSFIPPAERLWKRGLHYRIQNIERT